MDDQDQAGPAACSRTSSSATSTSILSDGRFSQADNVWFTCLTMNTNPIHFDAEYTASTEFKRPLVNSCFTLALVTGQSVIDLTMNGVANLGWDEVRLPHPLFEGDTVYAKSEVLETRESKSRPAVGIVRVKTTGLNQDGAAVIEFMRTFMIWKRGHVPAARPRGTS